MSENVGSGDNASQLPEQEQILLDWQELSSYAEMTRPAGVEVPEQSQAEATETLRAERLTAQARGDRLLRAAAESLPITDEPALLEAPSNVAGEAPEVDTVMLRAEQALGYDQFADLTTRLLELSYRADPDEVTQEFRNEAQKVSLIDAGDLWEAVSHRAKIERFGEKNEKRKFYYSTSLEDLADILKTGELVRTDQEGSALKSDLKFSYDEVGNGEWKSGFAKERGAKSQEVTMVFDDGLLDEETFVAIGKNPSASMVDWRKSCVALVIEEETDAASVLRVLNACGQGGLPLYRDASREHADQPGWCNQCYLASSLAKTRDERMERYRRIQELDGELYGREADDVIEKHAEELAGQISEKEVRRLYERHGLVRTTEELHAMHASLVEYLSDVVGVDTKVGVDYINNPELIWTASWSNLTKSVVINEAAIEAERAASVAKMAGILGHALCHGYQAMQANTYKAEANERTEKTEEQAVNAGWTPEQRKYGELCYYNNLNYISVDCDFVAYRGQFVERDAYYLGDRLEREFGKVEKKLKQPVERARRLAKKVGSKIREISRKGERHE